MDDGTLKLVRDLAQDLAFTKRGETCDGYTVMVNEIVGTGRWSTHHWLVIEREGRFWAANYSRGATESQEEAPFENEDEVEFYEVFPVEQTVTQYMTRSDVDAAQG
jgi:pectin methylesterase-like acyl-CoA thioesterase